MVIKPFSLTSKFLRKHRKWPISPYKTKWQIAFNQNQALQTLKKSASQTPHHHHQQEDHDKPNHLLSALIHSFTSYQCDPTPEAYHFVIKTLTKTSQFHHIPCVLDRIESVEKFQTPEYILAELIRIYGRADRIEDAIDLFCRIPKFRCVPSVYSLNSLLSVLCRRRESIRLVPQMLMKSHVMRIVLEESSFRILISALCRIKKIGYAIQILNCMIDDGYDLDARICSLILSSLCEQKDLALANFEVLGFLEAMKKLGFSPGMMDYSNVIRFLVKEGRGLDAFNVLARMKVEGIKPDIVCYTMVLHGIIAEGEYGSADELFDELLVLGLVPDVYTYNVYINGLCKQNNVEAGLNMILSMEELGCKPNLITYNLLLKALNKKSELSRAKELMIKMDSKGVRVNSQTYRIMLDGLFQNGDMNEACVLMEEMLDKHLCHKCLTFDEIIYGLCQRGLVCKAGDLLKIMVGKNVAPGARAWEALLLSSRSKFNVAEANWTCENNGNCPGR
ncbi:pentatricopeptide repeat-containing protein At2g38420, mitochondrial [Ziziphus jujuba]|uniref:Pentatricopeptide repeat-containing protein At2g38420, mitochondrial n=1 Tax=Ziziphus jujuba TaxID=326968 RepID=A0ABM3I2R7_ZIZJJ|nr:pentatricopeptide repeat-containing protein At2g38420, mitochondrial [Ziziphus jujuba]